MYKKQLITWYAADHVLQVTVVEWGKYQIHVWANWKDLSDPENIKTEHNSELKKGILNAQKFYKFFHHTSASLNLHQYLKQNTSVIN